MCLWRDQGDMLPTPFDDLDPHEVLCPKELAERLHVDPRSVRRAIARGELRASRACGLRVLASDVADWWRSRAVAAAPVETPALPAVPTPRRRAFERRPVRLLDRRDVHSPLEGAGRGKPRRTFDSLEDALDYKAKLRSATRWRPEELRQERAGRTTLAEFFEEWWRTHGMVELKRSTLKTYRCLWEAHAAPRLGSVALREIDAHRVVAFRGDLIAAGVGPQSIVKTMSMSSASCATRSSTARSRATRSRRSRSRRQDRRARRTR